MAVGNFITPSHCASHVAAVAMSAAFSLVFALWSEGPERSAARFRVLPYTEETPRSEEDTCKEELCGSEICRAEEVHALEATQISPLLVTSEGGKKGGHFSGGRDARFSS